MKIRLIDINVPIVHKIFRLRFKVAYLTRKSGIINRIIKKFLFEHDGTYFIPSNNSVKNDNIEEIEVNIELDKTESIVMPSDLIKIMINQSEDIVIMNECLCRSSTKCDDYPRDLGCIFIGKTTRKISRKHCHEATKQEAIEHIEKSNRAGLIHIMGRNKIDSIWMNVRPDDELLTICNCCPCCCLWRVYPKLSNQIQNDFYKLPGVHVEYDADECINCRKCIEVCFADAIKAEDNKISIDNSICIGCGQCSNNCPTEAIKLNYENENPQSVLDKINTLVKIK